MKKVTNKHTRIRMKMLKFKNRLKRFKLLEKNGDIKEGNFNGYRTTSTPCSCKVCQSEKYSRKRKHKNMDTDE